MIHSRAPVKIKFTRVCHKKILANKKQNKTCDVSRPLFASIGHEDDNGLILISISQGYFHLMQLMNVDGLTRENVASHLQKYRLQLRKEEGRGEGPDNGYEEDHFLELDS